MKRLTRHLPLVLAANAIAIGMSLALSAWAGTTANCYNYNGDGSCASNQYCTPGPLSQSNYYCKQLWIPYSDPGCCSYFRIDTNWVNSGGECPCAGTTTTTITLANNNPLAVCYSGSEGSTEQPPHNTDTLGLCGTPPSPPGGG